MLEDSDIIWSPVVELGRAAHLVTVEERPDSQSDENVSDYTP